MGFSLSPTHPQFSLAGPGWLTEGSLDLESHQLLTKRMVPPLVLVREVFSDNHLALLNFIPNMVSVSKTRDLSG